VCRVGCKTLAHSINSVHLRLCAGFSVAWRYTLCRVPSSLVMNMAGANVECPLAFCQLSLINEYCSVLYVQATEATVSMARRCRRTPTKRLNMPANPTGLQSDTPVCCYLGYCWQRFCFHLCLSVCYFARESGGQVL